MNSQKSVTIGVNVPLELKVRAAEILNFSRGSLPTVYLGMPLGGCPQKSSFWNPVVEKMAMKLRSWNSKYLSLSGQLVLIKSVLNAIPLYHTTVFKAPKGVVKDMERVMRSFLWGGVAGSRKIAWVAWEDICKGIRFGDLGLGSLEWKNKALLLLLLKWFWRFGREKEALWRRECGSLLFGKVGERQFCGGV